jgi:hypothetical protein
MASRDTGANKVVVDKSGGPTAALFTPKCVSVEKSAAMCLARGRPKKIKLETLYYVTLLACFKGSLPLPAPLPRPLPPRHVLFLFFSFSLSFFFKRTSHFPGPPPHLSSLNFLSIQYYFRVDCFFIRSSINNIK